MKSCTTTKQSWTKCYTTQTGTLERAKSSNLKDQSYSSKRKSQPSESYIRAYKLAVHVIKLLRTVRHEVAARVIADQLIRSITSIGANILEAKSASSKKDFINFFTHALKSANESKFWLGLLRDSGYLTPEQLAGCMQETEELSRILAASILTMKGKR